MSGHQSNSSEKQVPSESLWLYTHCRAIGMTKRSVSGKWDHDIALFTVDLQERNAELLAALIELHEAEEARHPNAEQGQDAQTAWSMRKAAAHESARTAIQRATT